MTGKRFTMIYFETDGNLIFDEQKHTGEWYDSTKCLQDDEVVELLNNLSEENGHLNDTVDNITNHLQEVLEENAKLLQERNYFERKKTEYLTKLNECRLDNTDLTNK